jgi:hypothetical protein
MVNDGFPLKALFGESSAKSSPKNIDSPSSSISSMGSVNLLKGDNEPSLFGI